MEKIGPFSRAYFSFAVLAFVNDLDALSLLDL